MIRLKLSSVVIAIALMTMISCSHDKAVLRLQSYDNPVLVGKFETINGQAIEVDDLDARIDIVNSQYYKKDISYSYGSDYRGNTTLTETVSESTKGDYDSIFDTKLQTLVNKNQIPYVKEIRCTGMQMMYDRYNKIELKGDVYNSK